MRKFLKLIQVIQEKRIITKYPNKRLGKHTSSKYRINPYNPLSYVAIIIIFIVGILMFGLAGFWREVDLKRNIFKYN